MKGIVQVVLLVLLVKYFGLQSWERYKDEKTVVISEEKDLGPIPAPSVTVCALNPETQMGYKDNSLEYTDYRTSALIDDICKGLHGEDIVRCVEKKTYNLSTVVKHTSKGLAQNNRQKNRTMDHNLTENIQTGSQIWNPEFSYNGAGLCHQLEANMTLGTYQDTDVMWIKSNPNVSSFVLIHDPKLFYLTPNPELPFNAMTVDNMKMHSFKLVKHTNLDLTSKPCNSDPLYSFTACITDPLSKEVGCRLHWDRRTGQDLPICHQMGQYRFFEPIGTHWNLSGLLQTIETICDQLGLIGTHSDQICQIRSNVDHPGLILTDQDPSGPTKDPFGPIRTHLNI